MVGRVELLLQLERCQDGPLGMVLLGQRCAEQDQKTIAGNRLKRTAIVLYGLPHQTVQSAQLAVQHVQPGPTT